MGDFLHWQVAAAKNELKRSYFVYGPDRFLVEKVVDGVKAVAAPGDLDYLSLRAGTAHADIWDAINQYPMTSGRRLVVIRDAERIEKWDPFERWLKVPSIPVTVLFVSAEARKFGAKDKKTGEVLQHPIQDYLRGASKGRVVFCGLSEERAVTYVAGHGLSRSLARRVLTLTRFDIGLVFNFLRKMSYFRIVINDRVIDAWADTKPADDFRDELLAMRKPQALATIPAIPEDAYPRIVRMLDSDLEHMLRLRKMRFEDAVRLPPQAKKRRKSAKYYDRNRVRKCLDTLAFIDVAMQRAWRETKSLSGMGLLETLVALW